MGSLLCCCCLTLRRISVNVRLEVLTETLKRITVIRGMTTCRLEYINQCLGTSYPYLVGPEDVDTRLSRNSLQAVTTLKTVIIQNY